jgi:septal ring-binding cell division protein DamX
MSTLVVLAAGCTASSPRNDRENWVCARTADGRDWNCNQQRAHYGVAAAADVPAAVETGDPDGRSSAGVAAHQVTRATPAEAAVSGGSGGSNAPGYSLEAKFNRPAAEDAVRDADKWNATLPALSVGVPDAPLESPLKPVAQEQRKPPPEPEPFFARWEKKADARALVEPSAGAASAPGAEVENKPAAPARRRSVPAVDSGSGTDRAATRRGYTVQVGAFKSDRAARAYIAQHKLGALPDLVVHPESQGPEHYVLVTFGRFETVRAALEAWRSSGAASDLEIWVRPVAASQQAPPEALPKGVGSAAE